VNVCAALGSIIGSGLIGALRNHRHRNSAQITEATVSQPQSGDGYGIELTWQITEGTYENRFLWQRVTFQHSSTQAQRIGRAQFKDLCTACGVTEAVNDLDLFKLIPCKVRVGIEKDKNGVYDDKNRVTRVWPASYEPPAPKRAATIPASQPPKPLAAATPPNGDAPSGAKDPPWRAKPPATDDNIPFE
jgi:hypothetical protein